MAEILLVDDDVSLAETVRDILCDLGHRVRVAHDGQAGLAELDKGLPDLLLLDIEMPVLDGPGMAYEMLIHDAGRERIPIVLVSGYVGLREVADRIGTPYAAGKPCGLDELLGLVERALRERAVPAPQGSRSEVAR